ncbi:hypothetical protein Y032_0129g1470 [Ancylostoma ceylanicum]|uniref:Uncharacterized protein n=1 Tax=Ancylostoma ceylanicum TaxID=53326 RepID=A0A016T6R3_9BILA|nr:hypothetical protein Y032_0129g1470 [Ancylostoma ceylanicum]
MISHRDNASEGSCSPSSHNLCLTTTHISILVISTIRTSAVATQPPCNPVARPLRGAMAGGMRRGRHAAALQLGCVADSATGDVWIVVTTRIHSLALKFSLYLQEILSVYSRF